MQLEALIFDVDGTLAETEETHRAAFNKAFALAGLDWHWSVEDYRELLKTTGGKERIAAHIKVTGFSGDIDIPSLHAVKTRIYVEAVRNGALKLRPGIEALLNHARDEGIRLAIATTTSRPNVDQLLESTLGSDSVEWFDAIACGDEVKHKKPDPAVYLLALEKLKLKAENCLAFEDSVPGLKSAVSANLPTFVTPSVYTSGDDFFGAELVVENLAKSISCLETDSASSHNGIRDLLIRLMGLT